MRAIQITEFGGPEVLTLADLPTPEPSAGQDLIRVRHAGVNYADTHQAENSYLAPQQLPMVPGSEVVGLLPDGRRVMALVDGGYAEYAVAPSASLIDVPDGVSDGQALALLVQGLTAWHLLRTTTHLTEGESVVVHAGAGGVGSLAVQLAKAWGAGRVIATASTPEKRELAESLGADVAVDGEPAGLNERLREANGGAKVDIVLEMVGGLTTDESFRALAPFGRLAVYGQASREPFSPLDPSRLMVGSRTVAGFWLVDCLRRPGMLTGPMAELLALTRAGTLNPVTGPAYPLEDVARAHQDMRDRKTTGKVTLQVSQ